jgi:cytochrome c-type biogenesis protein CcmE
VDLSPRVDQPAPAPPRRRGKRWPAIVVLVLVLGGGVVIVSKFLSSAIDYYCNVDEVGTKDGCEAGRRLRVQGNVVEGSVGQDGDATLFDIEFNGVTMPVRYDPGDPGGIFQECVPVVVHGRLEQGVFVGDDIEVKHSNEYEAANKDRLDQASNACQEQAAQEQQG